MSKKLFAEFFGTFWLVFGGCGSAIFAASVNLGIGYVGVAFAFGLTVLTMAYAVGHISGGHFNPAVTLGLVAGGRFSAKDALPYIVSQVVGGLAAGAALYLIASGKAGFDVTAGFASNGYGDHSPEGYSLEAVFVAEVLLTAFFLLIIMGSTHKNAAAGFAPIAIGLGLTLIHLISIPYTTAVFGGEARVHTLYGDVMCKIKEGTQSGSKIRLRGKGIVSMKDANVHGDQYVTVQIQVPRHLNAEARQKLMEYKKAAAGGR